MNFHSSTHGYGDPYQTWAQQPCAIMGTATLINMGTATQGLGHPYHHGHCNPRARRPCAIMSTATLCNHGHGDPVQSWAMWPLSSWARRPCAIMGTATLCNHGHGNSRARRPLSSWARRPCAIMGTATQGLGDPVQSWVWWPLSSWARRPSSNMGMATLYNHGHSNPNNLHGTATPVNLIAIFEL